MGVSVSVRIVIGFQVYHEDFWTTESWTDEHKSCDEGHPQTTSKHKHCPECGGEFEFQRHTEKVPTERFAEWVAENHPNDLPDEIWDPDDDCGCLEDRINGSCFAPFTVCYVDTKVDSEVGAKTLVIGIRGPEIRRINEPHEPSISALTKDELDVAFQKCHDFAGKLETLLRRHS